MTEVYPDPEHPLQFPVVPKQDVVVRRHTAPFGVSLFDPQACGRYRRKGQTAYRLKKGNAHLPIHNHEEPSFPRCPRYDEVAFRIADPHPFVDICGSLINEGAVDEGLGSRMFPPSSSSFQPPMRFYPPSVRAFEIAVNAVFGYGGKDALAVLQASGNGARRLVVVKKMLHKCTKGSVLHDLHALIFCFFSPDIRSVMGFARVIRSLDPIAC